MDGNAANREVEMRSIFAGVRFDEGSEEEEVSSPRELKAFYSVPEFARLCSVNRNVMARLLSEANVTFIGNGRGRRVPLSEIRDKLPAVFESFLLVKSSTNDE